MNLNDHIIVCLRKYFVFHGRATRSEFWSFHLFFFLVFLILFTFLENTFIFTFFNWFFMIPLTSVSCRRLHDIGKNGWWQCLFFTGIGLIWLIFWWCKESEVKDNKYSIERTESEKKDDQYRNCLIVFDILIVYGVLLFIAVYGPSDDFLEFMIAVTDGFTGIDFNKISDTRFFRAIPGGLVIGSSIGIYQMKNMKK